jgi:hypothetical protein
MCNKNVPVARNFYLVSGLTEVSAGSLDVACELLLVCQHLQTWRKCESLYSTNFDFCKIFTPEIIPLAKLNVKIC